RTYLVAIAAPAQRRYDRRQDPTRRRNQATVGARQRAFGSDRHDLYPLPEPTSDRCRTRTVVGHRRRRRRRAEGPGRYFLGRDEFARVYFQPLVVHAFHAGSDARMSEPALTFPMRGLPV